LPSRSKATVASRRLVAFDEAGNTGQNLLDPDQPVFVLASVSLDQAAAEDALARVVPSGAEAKFTKLRKSSAGRRSVLDFLNSEVVSIDHLKFTVYHKRFMVVTKIVDMLVEPLAHLRGHDLYARGENLAMANLIYTVTGTYCGHTAFDQLLECFVAMVRRKSSGTVTRFYAQVDRMRKTNRQRGFDPVLGLIAATRPVVDIEVHENDTVALDPAVSTFADLAAQWTAVLREPFDIVHDQSKPIEHEKEVLESLMTTAEPARVFEGPGPPRQWPLLSTGITFANSHDVPQIQLADLFSGAVSTIFTAKARGATDDFAVAIAATSLGQIPFEPVWPSSKVTPDELDGELRQGGGEAVEYLTALSRREQARRRHK
jgi:hypothetical protein